MGSGPKPKPALIHLLNGNPSKKPPEELEDIPGLDGEPPQPLWVKAAVREHWEMLKEHLDQMGLLARSDMALMASYCQTMVRWEQAEEEIHDRGILVTSPTGEEKKNPAITVAEKCQELLLRIGNELGLSPVARARLKNPGKKKGKEEERFFK